MARAIFLWFLGIFLCFSLGPIYAQDLEDDSAFVEPGSAENLEDGEASDEEGDWGDDNEDEEGDWNDDDEAGVAEDENETEFRDDEDKGKVLPGDNSSNGSVVSNVHSKLKHREILGSSENPLGYSNVPARALEIEVSWLYRKGIPVDPGPLPESFGSIESGDDRGLFFSQDQRVRVLMGVGDTSRLEGSWIIARKGKAFISGASGRLLGYLLRGVGIIDRVEAVGSHYEGIIAKSFEAIFDGDVIVPLSYWESIAEEIRLGSPDPQSGTIHGQVLSIIYERNVGGAGDAIILDRGMGSNLKPGVRLDLEFPLTKPSKKYMPPSGIEEPTRYGKFGQVEILWVSGALSLGRVLDANKPVRSGGRISINLSSQDAEEDGSRR